MLKTIVVGTGRENVDGNMVQMVAGSPDWSASRSGYLDWRVLEFDLHVTGCMQPEAKWLRTIYG